MGARITSRGEISINPCKTENRWEYIDGPQQRSHSLEYSMRGLSGDWNAMICQPEFQRGSGLRREELVWSLETGGFIEYINREEVCQLNSPLSTSLIAYICKPSGELSLRMGCWHTPERSHLILTFGGTPSDSYLHIFSF